MAVFHFTVKIVGRSKGKSIISASAYLNGDVMKNEETGTEIKQREQSGKHSSLKERLEENKRIVAERERENARCRNHDRGMSR